MREPNPFAKEETLTIIETRPRKARIPTTVRAVCIRPDPKDWKAKPRLDDIDAVMARLPPGTVELLDVDYNCRLTRLPSLDRQSHIRYVHLGAHKLRDCSTLFTLTRLERLLLVSVPFTSLSAFQNRSLKYVRLIRGRNATHDLRQRQHWHPHSPVVPARGSRLSCDRAGGSGSCICSPPDRWQALLPCLVWIKPIPVRFEGCAFGLRKRPGDCS
jgi:hypothetical protein